MYRRLTTFRAAQPRSFDGSLKRSKAAGLLRALQFSAAVMPGTSHHRAGGGDLRAMVRSDDARRWRATSGRGRWMVILACPFFACRVMGSDTGVRTDLAPGCASSGFREPPAGSRRLRPATAPVRFRGRPPRASSTPLPAAGPRIRSGARWHRPRRALALRSRTETGKVRAADPGRSQSAAARVRRRSRARTVH